MSPVPLGGLVEQEGVSTYTEKICFLQSRKMKSPDNIPAGDFIKKNYRRRIAKKPMPRAAAPITKAGSTGDFGEGVGQVVGILSVDFLMVVAVVTGAAGVSSSGRARETGVSFA
jgi:hypothetical protein